jgi:peroxiredoxin
MRALYTLALAAALPLACGGGESANTPGGALPTSSGNAQDFTAQDVNGKTVHLSDHLGKDVVLINFWGTFCEPCLAEFPHLNRIYNTHKSKGFVVLAVSMDGPDTIASVPAFAARNSLSFPVLLDEDSHVAAIYNPKKSAPLSVVIDRSGRIVRTHEGYNPGDEVELEKTIAELVGASPAAAGSTSVPAPAVSSPTSAPAPMSSAKSK